MLGTGPSRKRGPPKGYIDAIEARLHQTEALLGIMLSCDDDRAVGLLRDISQDPLAKEIINRVDNSSYGVKGRQRDSNRIGNGNKGRYAQAKEDNANSELASTHPSNEWQDRVTVMLHNIIKTRDNKMDTPRNALLEVSDEDSEPHLRRNLPSIMTTLPSDRPSTATTEESGGSSPGRRQRRRIADGPSSDSALDEAQKSASTPSTSISINSPHGRSLSSHSHSSLSPGRSLGYSQSPLSSDAGVGGPSYYNLRSPRSSSNNSVAEGNLEDYTFEEDDIPGAIGQLSLNEDEQVRYHGKASGLYLLGTNDRTDERNAGGIWRFPRARVWPPVPRSPLPAASPTPNDPVRRLPPPYIQEKLLDLYFTYVHPVLPVIHKQSFFENLRAFPASSGILSPRLTPTSTSTSGFDLSTSSPYNSRRRRVPALLLFAIFAVAARYSETPGRPSTDNKTYHTEADSMWDAGDEYLDQAQRLLERSYANSQPETCQALLLMGYREIGIGAMAEAWTYVGMAIRMAQDLGMHRRADGWARAGLGGRIFGDQELQERRRIWFSCVIMDKYVSSYIGRPLMIFERDFDTLLPSEEDPEEEDSWTPHGDADKDDRVPGKIISCFNAAAVLSGILSMIIQAIYAVRPVCSRHGESVFLEGILDKWLHELPQHLRHEPSSPKKVPLPHILTLHMQYWTAVLLLHRPFMRMGATKNKSDTDANEEDDLRASTQRHYELSTGAANRITSIATLYMDNYPPQFCPAYLCYYIFTASLMHMTALSEFPTNPQARIGLRKCTDVLHAIEVVWPSAGRALELLRGSKISSLEDEGVARSASEPLDRRKRSYTKVSDDRPQSSTGITYSTPYPVKDDNYNANSQYRHNPNHTAGPSSQPSPSGTYYRMDQRWTPEHHFENMQYSGSLTTSVLPQSYSTGLVDDRPVAVEHRSHMHSSMSHHPNDSAVDIRYPPQYWDDYSAYTQVNTQNSYEQLPHQSQASPVHPHPPSSSHVFLHGQTYNHYNNPS
ncbi:hypothetical protein V5O48_000392 [Marasmius crinis-equi]|uniref:Xylanolytic transcriptional activator regulatory domain-containing protein n=1 Tax=Marasmius crinis-equi TaxID=585013 RepID=A0ABR3G1S0_9AGAR